jgi:hypothetical protein
MISDKHLAFSKLFETHSSEHGISKQDIIENVSKIDFAKATSYICFAPKEVFEKEHELFKQLGIKYINFNETEPTTLLWKIKADIIQHDSRVLPETENYYIENKIHNNLQKFSPDKVNEGFDILVKFIEDRFRL